jgi:predicted nucleic acid-binding protein
MIVYVESNFVLELAFRQEQADSCRRVLTACTIGGGHLVLPAFSVAEPFQAFVARVKARNQAARDLRLQLDQLARSETLAGEAEPLLRLTGLLVRSAEEERTGLQAAMQVILDAAELIPLDADVVREAGRLEASLSLSPQDAIVLASVLKHLGSIQPERSCFLNRNSKDFDNPDIVNRLQDLGCKLLPRFDTGLEFIEASATGPSRNS